MLLAHLPPFIEGDAMESVLFQLELYGSEAAAVAVFVFLA